MEEEVNAVIAGSTGDGDNEGDMRRVRTISDDGDWFLISRDDVVDAESTDESESVEVLSEGCRSSSSFDEAEINALMLSRPASSLSDEWMARFEAEEASKDKNENIFIYLGISLLIVAGVMALNANDDLAFGPSEFSRTTDDFAKDSKYDALRSEVRSIQENNVQMKAILSALEKTISDVKRLTSLPVFEAYSGPECSHYAHSATSRRQQSLNPGRGGDDAENDSPEEKIAQNSARRSSMQWKESLDGVKNEVNVIRNKLFVQAHASAVSVKTSIHNGLCESEMFLGNSACSCRYQDIFYYPDSNVEIPVASKKASQLASILETIDIHLKNNVNHWHDFVLTSLDGSFLKIIEMIQLGVDNNFRRVRDDVLTSLSCKIGGEKLPKKIKQPTVEQETPMKHETVSELPMKPATERVERVTDKFMYDSGHERERREPEKQRKSEVNKEENEDKLKEQDLNKQKNKLKKQKKLPKDSKKPTREQQRKQHSEGNRKIYGHKTRGRSREERGKRREDYSSFFHKQYKWLKKSLKSMAHRGKKERDSFIAAVRSFYEKHGSGLRNKFNRYISGFEGILEKWKLNLFKNEKPKRAPRRRDKDDGDGWRKFRGRKSERKERSKRHSESEVRERQDSGGYYRKCLSRRGDNNYTESYDDDFVDKQQASWFVKMGKHRSDLRLRGDGGSREDWFLRRAKARRERTR